MMKRIKLIKPKPCRWFEVQRDPNFLDAGSRARGGRHNDRPERAPGIDPPVDPAKGEPAPRSTEHAPRSVVCRGLIDVFPPTRAPKVPVHRSLLPIFTLQYPPLSRL